MQLHQAECVFIVLFFVFTIACIAYVFACAARVLLPLLFAWDVLNFLYFLFWHLMFCVLLPDLVVCVV